MVVQVDGVDERLIRTKQASEETGSTGSVRREAREERISRQDKAEAPSGDADKPSTWTICRIEFQCQMKISIDRTTCCKASSLTSSLELGVKKEANSSIAWL